ncbi:MAG: ROK family protein, partial [Patescibacteria group bacterium]
MTIGIDIGGTNIKGVLLKNNKVIDKIKIRTKSKSNKKILIAQIFECISHLLKGKRRVKKIGIGVAGPVDFKNQKVLNPPNVTGLKGLYLGKLVKERFTPHLKK